jgi:hypothetical protein
MTELENLQAIIADDTRSAEERKAAAEHIIALTSAQPTLAQAIAPTGAKMSQSDAESLAKIKQILAELREDDPAPYFAAHKKCTVCLRHNAKEVPACELCGSGRWEPATNHHPTWTRTGRTYDSTREHLSNMRGQAASLFDATHLRWLLTWRERDGTRQINAAKFVPTPFVLSYEQRCWCNRLLEWIEPGQVVPEPEPDAPEPQAEDDKTDTPEREISPGDLNKLFQYHAWKIERESAALPSSVADWIAMETGIHIDTPLLKIKENRP